MTIGIKVNIQGWVIFQHKHLIRVAGVDVENSSMFRVSSPIVGILERIDPGHIFSSVLISKSGSEYILHGPPKNVFEDPTLRKLINYTVGSSDWDDVSYLVNCVFFHEVENGRS